ncbi:MAG: hypothetical protein GXP23_02935 [Gammaproteobacteria bacterium]|nr:hypothetical protein [Gammaproteobacteria bacterium]
MKLLSKLSLTILSFLFLFGLLWLSLPRLLAGLAEYQLEQSGFSDVEVKISDIGLESVTVDRLKMSITDLDIVIEGLQARYHLSQLISGKLISIEVKAIVLNRLQTADSATVLPGPALLSGLLTLRWQQYIPEDFLSVDTLSLYGINGKLSLSASIDVSRQGDNTQAEIRLVDSKGKNHQLELQASPDSGVDLQWQIPDSVSETPVSVRIYPVNNGSGLAGQIRVDLSAVKGLVAELNGLSGQMQANFSYIRQAGSAKKDISLSAKITDAGFAGSRAKAVTADVQAVIKEKDGGFNLQFAPSSRVEMDALQEGNNRIEKVIFKLPQALLFVEGRPLINRKNGAEITFRNAVLDNIQIADMQIKEIALATGPVKGGPDNCSFNMKLIVPAIQINDVQFQSSPFKVETVCPSADSPQWSVVAEVRSVGIENDDFRLPLTECRMTAKSPNDSQLSKITGNVTCQSENQKAKLSTHFRFNTASESGYADYSFDGIKPDNDKPLFGSLLKNWQQAFDIVSGTHSVKGRYRWWKKSKGQDAETLTLALTVDNAGGYYDDILFSGLNYKDRIELLPAIKSSEFAAVTVRNIDIGIPITSVRAKILLGVSDNGPLPLIKVNGLSLSLLDGKVEGNGLKIDLNNDKHELVLVVVGLDLARVVALQQLDGLSATGRLDGYIPVTITNKGIKITKGKIVAQPQGGYIHYRPKGGTSEIEKSAMGSEFVFRIIEDLNYNSLNVDVDYDEDGEMEMKLGIKGISPKVDANRPIHFNLNLQQNVLKLLQSLRYSEGLSKDIDKNVQKHFRK